jgi:tetratricopeptide (TPR) repeat protein
MGVMAAAPVLVSQLMSFQYSLPFILSVYFLGNLPIFAAVLLLSCIAAAWRPLRFRSRFIAVVLCMSPQLLYWGYFGGARGMEPIEWGFSYTPWLSAWLIGLSMAGFVLGIGHFTRYRPGLVWLSTALVLVICYYVFHDKIGFDELDYQLYISRNNPEDIREFHDHSVTAVLDEMITNPKVKRFLVGFFYPDEPILLRAELKKEIQNQLRYDRWPSWFAVPEDFKYQQKKESLLNELDAFIAKRSKSHRMPIALYYKGLLIELKPDIDKFGRKEILHFYSDYPIEDARDVWYRIYRDFGSSAESIEARWRVAVHWARQGRFEQADKILSEALQMAEKILQKREENSNQQTDSFFSPFHPSEETIITKSKLAELQIRSNQTRMLISDENKGASEESKQRLAGFIKLNPYGLSFSSQLDELLGQIGEDDPLRDNILLARTKVIYDEQLKTEKLFELHDKYPKTDGGMIAMYEMGLLKISMWRQENESSELKKRFLSEARAIMTSFLNLYPNSPFSERVKNNLDGLPVVD